ncbi:hypothetical protein EV192_12062 [Actinocrispum wychmicini]|uniref:Uncharacterized protein n=1 Tax=Actinocrispum wychmicini TaxID=1213861 RepID=A0A4R2INF1_9PSEU|nr:hypothetical protein EV192_12062 [Actinocrispum wychmicini]
MFDGTQSAAEVVAVPKVIEVIVRSNGLGLVMVNWAAPVLPGNRSAFGSGAATMVRFCTLPALRDTLPVASVVHAANATEEIARRRWRSLSQP